MNWLISILILGILIGFPIVLILFCYHRSKQQQKQHQEAINHFKQL